VLGKHDKVEIMYETKEESLEEIIFYMECLIWCKQLSKKYRHTRIGEGFDEMQGNLKKKIGISQRDHKSQFGETVNVRLIEALS
jgi:hypothetical protein